MAEPPEVVLVQPRAGGYSEALQPPMLPLALLAAASRLAAERAVLLVDARVERGWRERLRSALRAAPVCVGLTSITGGQLSGAAEAARLVREEGGGTPVVWGGVHASLLPEQTLASGLADAVVVGEGEDTFPKLVDAMEGGAPLSSVPGVAYLDGGRAVRTVPAPPVDLDAQPDPPYHLVEVERYVQRYDGRRTLLAQTSRGCPHACRFCVNACYHGSRWRGQSAERALDSFERLASRFRAENLWLADDNFFADLHRAKDVARGLAARGLGLTWEAPGTCVRSVLALGADGLALLHEGGCRRLYIGAESGSPRVLGAIGKGITVEDVLRANRLLASSPVVPTYNLMLGFPGESEGEARATVALALRLLDENPRAEVAPLYSYTPYPGTALFDEAVAAGLRPPDSLEGWASFEWSRANLPWLDEGARRRLESLYFYSLFLDRKWRHDLPSPLMRAAARLYSPVARARVRRGWLGAPLEHWAARRLLGQGRS